MDDICKNCDSALEPGFQYCPICSQKANLHRLSMNDVIHDGIHYFTHADKGIFQLLRDLAIKNGVVAREFIEGKRKKYFSPLNFFLLVAATFVFILSLQQLPEPSVFAKNQTGLNEISDPVLKELLIQKYERNARAMIFLNKYSNLLAMLSLPLTAFFFWLFYRVRKYNYTEHLVAGMYMIGFTILIYAVIIVPAFMALDAHSDLAHAFCAVFQLVYFTVFYYNFNGKGPFRSILKAFGASFCALFFWMATTGLIVGIYISNGFWGLIE